jgi:hypothetical protein
MYKVLNVTTAFAMIATLSTVPAQAASYDAAIKQCRLVASEEATVQNSSDHRYRGYCVAATATYLTDLSGSGLPQVEFGTELATYVVLLTELLNERVCGPESEIPRAIAMAADASIDVEQAEQMRLIATTLFGCDVTATAAVLRPVPIFDSSDSSSSDSLVIGTRVVSPN